MSDSEDSSSSHLIEANPKSDQSDDTDQDCDENVFGSNIKTKKGRVDKGKF